MNLKDEHSRITAMDDFNSQLRTLNIQAINKMKSNIPNKEVNESTATCTRCEQRVGSANSIKCRKCQKCFHIACLSESLLNIFVSYWFCDNCKGKYTTGMDYDKKQYTGKVPNILSGQSWRYRQQLNKNHMHRPIMAGIYQYNSNPTFSIVLSGGYKYDADTGNEIVYTGAGGFDDKRNQVADQLLTNVNLSLASSCDAIVNNSGAEASDWTKSSPIRVIRGSGHAKKYPAFSPKDGYRYDGIYKMVKYWPYRDPETGFLVWLFMLRRHDSEPAPWTDLGIQYIKKMSIKYEHVDNIKKSSTFSIVKKIRQSANTQVPVFKVYKPTNIAIFEKEPVSPESPELGIVTSAEFEVPQLLLQLIQSDIKNKSIWENVLSLKFDTIEAFLLQVRKYFTCSTCLYLVNPYQPHTMLCGHNICRPCLVQNLKVEISTCSSCYKELYPSLLNNQWSNYDFEKDHLRCLYVNIQLSKILMLLLPLMSNYDHE